MGDVKVSLGSSKDFTDRLFELKQLSAKFGTLKGTLYLDDYNGDESSIIFKREKWKNGWYFKKKIIIYYVVQFLEIEGGNNLVRDND